MGIYRKARPTDNFYLLDKNISEDGRLSWGARGLLIFLLGKPDHWRVSTSHLVKQTEGSAKPAKRDAVRALLSELIDAGYVVREPVRDENGAFKGTDYAVSEIPVLPETDSPETDNPGPVEPSPDNPPLVSIEGLARNETPASNETPQPPSSPDGDGCALDDAFEVFWTAGMVKTNKKAARARFMKLAKKERDPMEFAQGLSEDIQARLAAGQLGFEKMHPTTYLNGERWLDDIVPADKRQDGRKLPPQRGFADMDYKAGLRVDKDGRFRI